MANSTLKTTRCKTGWRIRRDSTTKLWEAYNRYHFDGPPMEFPTWRRAYAYVVATTYGRHERATGASFIAPRMIHYPEARHLPREGCWEASWLLLGHTDEDEPRWKLSQEGWKEALGISGAAFK